MKLYAKLLIDSTDFYCNKNNHFQYIDYKQADELPAGYMEFIMTNRRPDPVPDGEIISYHVWVENGILYREYMTALPDDPRFTIVKYSKLKIIAGCKAIGKWETLKAWIQESGMYDEWLACQCISNDYAAFYDVKSLLIRQNILTQEEIDSILNVSIIV